MKLKFCGIRREQDIEYVNEIKPDYIGFIFAPSKRYISPEDAAKLIEKASPEIQKVGVFVNEAVSEVLKAVLVSGIDIIQLHGDETSDYIDQLRSFTDCEIWKAVRVKTSEDIINAEKLGADKMLLDSFSESQYGGTGKVADWDVIKKTDIKTPFFIAGGLNENNILSAVSELSPYGLDISGGIETDGCKDREKMKKISMLLNR